MGSNPDKQSIDDMEYKESILSRLYEEYYDKIARYAYLRVGNKAEAEDIAGEVFLKALKSLKSYKERGAPMQTWLFRIAHNLVVDYFRKNKKVKTVSIENIQIESKINPVTKAERDFQIERLKEAMEQLTQEQREVIRLRFFGELTSREAGQILNKSDGAVREMQRAAIEKLRNLLATDS
jgi:RNA polymerase sigma-70 factor (ECF subfamily)